MTLIRRLAAVMVLFLILTGFSGCTGESGTKSTEKGRETTVQKEEDTQTIANKDGLDPVTLTFYIPGEEKSDAKEVLDKVAEKSGLNIKLDFKYIPGIYSSGLKMIIDSNQPIDAFYAGAPEGFELANSPMNYIDMARNGMLKDITDLLPKYAPSIYSQLEKTELKNAEIDDKLYVVPSLWPLATNVCAITNIDLMNKYRIGPLNTFEDYDAYLKTIKENEPDIIPGQVSIYDQEMFMIPYGYVLMDKGLSLVYKWDDPKMKICPWEQTDEFKAVMRMLSGWQKSGYLAGPNDGIDKKKASFLSMGGLPKERPIKTTQSDGSRLVKSDNMYGYLLYKDSRISRGNPVGSIYMKGALALCSNSANPERTLMFLDWVQSSQENYDLLMYGIKDKHYTLDGELVVYPNDVKNINMFYPYWLSSPFRNMNYFRMSKDDDYASAEYREDFKNYIFSRTSYAPSTGFYPDYRNLSGDVRSRASKYQELVTYALTNGTFNPDDIESTIQLLKDTGTDKIVAELQRQLDQWRANR